MKLIDDSAMCNVPATPFCTAKHDGSCTPRTYKSP